MPSKTASRVQIPLSPPLKSLIIKHRVFQYWQVLCKKLAIVAPNGMIWHMNASNTKSGLKTREFPASSKIKIQEFINKKGGEAYSGSFQVVIPSKLTGTIRLRKNFKAKKDAEAWAKEQAKGYGALGVQYFRLTPDQKQEAAQAWALVKASGLSLMDVVKFDGQTTDATEIRVNKTHDNLLLATASLKSAHKRIDDIK